MTEDDPTFDLTKKKKKKKKTAFDPEADGEKQEVAVLIYVRSLLSCFHISINFYCKVVKNLFAYSSTCQEAGTEGAEEEVSPVKKEKKKVATKTVSLAEQRAKEREKEAKRLALI